jgi:hypothetical protein
MWLLVLAGCWLSGAEAAAAVAALAPAAAAAAVSFDAAVLSASCVIVLRQYCSKCA